MNFKNYSIVNTYFVQNYHLRKSKEFEGWKKDVFKNKGIYTGEKYSPDASRIYVKDIPSEYGP